MATIDEVIKKSLNPFDNSAAGNFWEEHEALPSVESIHQKPLIQIKDILGQITQDHQTRSLILYGDAGSGKTHFMGRVKKELNNQAFFVYIEPFPQSDHIWRHILRHTIDSLVNAPEGQVDSQLIIWLKSCLSTIRQGLKAEQQNLIDKIRNLFGKTDTLTDRQLFIDILKKTIGIKGIYNANEFFGVLYNLTNPDLYSLACEWLKGDDLDEESLKKLKVKQSIDDEDKARGILSNFSNISAKTQPIVLCFDQLDNIARLPDSSIDLQALFNVNSTIINGKWKGFLIIISIRTSTWNDNFKRVQASDTDRASIRISLKRITIEEGKALLASRLYPLHHQASPKPNSPIYPLPTQVLEKTFPSRKASPRNILMVGRYLLREYKEWLFRDKQLPSPKWIDGSNPPPPPPPEPDKIKAEFELLWQQEYQKVQSNINKISLLSSPALIRMLQEALAALQIQAIQPKLISGRYASHFLSYQQPENSEQIGVVWAEELNMNSFYNVMIFCQKAIQQKICQTLYLIRISTLGNSKNLGNKLYSQIFNGTQHCHIAPKLTSVHYLSTYHNFVNSALGQELVVADKIISLQELEALVRDTKVLNNCPLLQDLGVCKPSGSGRQDKLNLQPVEDYMFNLVKTQGYMGVPTLIRETSTQFSFVEELDIQKLIQKLCQEQKLEIIDLKAKPEEQLICLVIK
jgi:Cdc6-like AAA superfamily ATPase